MKKTLSIMAGIIGLWIGVFVANLYIANHLEIIGPIDCSGMNPCTNEEYIAYAIGFCIGGSIASMAIVSTIGVINNKKPTVRNVILSCLLGLLSWPLVAIVVFIVMLIPLDILYDIPTLRKSSGLLAILFSSAICGGLLGLICYKVSSKKVVE
jgi:hypothetical protein